MAGRTISGDARIKRITQILESEVDGDVIALDIEKGHCYGLNGTASHIWKLLEQERTLDAICADLVTRFDIERPQCQAEVAALIAQLEAEGLVEVKAPA